MTISLPPKSEQIRERDELTARIQERRVIKFRKKFHADYVRAYNISQSEQWRESLEQPPPAREMLDSLEGMI